MIFLLRKRNREEEPVTARRGSDRRLLGRGNTAPETILVERFLLPQQVVDDATQPGRQDRQRLARATLGRLLLLPLPGPRAEKRAQSGGLRRIPLHTGTHDLGAAMP